MDHINNLKVKELRVLLPYHSRSEKLKGIPNKVEVMGDVPDYFRKDWEGLLQRRGGVGVSVVTNEGVHEAVEYMVERFKFLV